MTRTAPISPRAVRDAATATLGRPVDAFADAAIPTPTLLAAVGPDTSPLGSSFCIFRGDGGQRLPDLLALPDAAHERLVREAGEHLATLHGADVGLRTSADGGRYSDLRVPDCHPDAPLTVDDVGSHTREQDAFEAGIRCRERV